MVQAKEVIANGVHDVEVVDEIAAGMHLHQDGVEAGEDCRVVGWVGLPKEVLDCCQSGVG